jgi:hypothetical protein
MWHDRLSPSCLWLIPVTERPVALPPNGNEGRWVKRQIERTKERLVRRAEQARERAQTLPPGKERDALLRKASRLETAAHIDGWLSSPGLRPPK